MNKKKKKIATVAAATETAPYSAGPTVSAALQCRVHSVAATVTARAVTVTCTDPEAFFLIYIINMDREDKM